jgi:predicted glycogen debranching enzyme
VIDGGQRDGAIRTNALLVLSLPHPLLDGERARRVLAVARERLLTPVDLRSLDPGDHEYRPRYEGASSNATAPYHHGTVWPWLIGPYVGALLRFGGAGGPRGRRAARWGRERPYGLVHRGAIGDL